MTAAEIACAAALFGSSHPTGRDEALRAGARQQPGLDHRRGARCRDAGLGPDRDQRLRREEYRGSEHGHPPRRPIDRLDPRPPSSDAASCSSPSASRPRRRPTSRSRAFARSGLADAGWRLELAGDGAERARLRRPRRRAGHRRRPPTSSATGATCAADAAGLDAAGTLPCGGARPDRARGDGRGAARRRGRGRGSPRDRRQRAGRRPAPGRGTTPPPPRSCARWPWTPRLATPTARRSSRPSATASRREHQAAETAAVYREVV